MKGLEYTNKYDHIYWAYNLPLQMMAVNKDRDDDDSEIIGWRILNYMARKERCVFLDELVSKEELPVICKNTAAVLRNLANQFEALAEGKIKYIYYPDNESYQE